MLRKTIKPLRFAGILGLIITGFALNSSKSNADYGGCACKWLTWENNLMCAQKPPWNTSSGLNCWLACWDYMPSGYERIAAYWGDKNGKSPWDQCSGDQGQSPSLKSPRKKTMNAPPPNEPPRLR